MIAWAIFCYSFLIIWGLFWPPIGWLFSLSVIIYLIYEIIKPKTKITTREDLIKESYLQKDKIPSKRTDSVKSPSYNRAKSDLKPSELLSKADALKKFAELRDQGIITEEEFNTKKKQILNDNKPSFDKESKLEKEVDVVSESQLDPSNEEELLLRSYLGGFKKIPPLSPEQQKTLGKQVQNYLLVEKTEIELFELNGNKPEVEQVAKKLDLATSQIEEIKKSGRKAKEKMVAANLVLVVAIAKEFTKKNLGLIELGLLELIQEGTIGLVRAVERFDPSKGYLFSTYSYWWIRQAMTRTIAEKTISFNENKLPIQITMQNRLKKARIELIQELSKTPTVSELAKYVGIPFEDIKDLLRKAGQPVSLETELSDKKFNLLLDLISGREKLPDEQIEKKYDLYSLLDQLPDLQCRVLKMKYGLDGYEPTSHQKIGSVLGISRKMVNTLEIRGIKRLNRLSNSVLDNF